MNRQAILAYAQAYSVGEKVDILRELSLANDHETIAVICDYIIEGRVPQAQPVAAPRTNVGPQPRKRKQAG